MLEITRKQNRNQVSASQVKLRQKCEEKQSKQALEHRYQKLGSNLLTHASVRKVGIKSIKNRISNHQTYQQAQISVNQELNHHASTTYHFWDALSSIHEPHEH